MAYVLETKTTMKNFGSAFCPKCGIIVADDDTRCPCCLYSSDTELTPAEAREFTCAGD